MPISTDIGGTFTDFVVLEGGRMRTFKVPSTPDQPERAIETGLARCVPATVFSHGTTLATNAVLERKGAMTGLLTTKGFAALLQIGRQQRTDLYRLEAGRPSPLVAPNTCFEVTERVSARGELITAPAAAELEFVAEQMRVRGLDSLAICFLFSFLNPRNEQVARDAFLEKGFSVSCSSEVLPEYREYERMSTTVMDAYLKRIVARYLRRIETLLGQNGVKQFYVMQSNGGVVKAAVMKHKPVNMLLSGPAGGVAAANYLGTLVGLKNIITFDMGGTSADVSSIVNGAVSWASEGKINGLPIKMPLVDIVTVGAGGGSIAWLDEGDALRVGPESAGAVPGPVCYDLGGTDVTVTDCDLLCGYLDPSYFLGGEMILNTGKARRRMEHFAAEIGLAFEETILGVWKIVNANMIRALRVVSVERGFDTRDFALCAFGGAGPVHAAALARELGIPQVIVPFASGVFSAYGILVSDLQQDYSRTHLLRLNEGDTEADAVVQETLGEFAVAAERELAEQGIRSTEATLIPTVDMRYLGQSYELNVDFTTVADARARFHQEHQKRYGYAMPAEVVELVTIRLRVLVPRSKPVPRPVPAGTAGKPETYRAVLFEVGWQRTPIFRRETLSAHVELEGPAIITATDSTTVVPPDSQFTVDDYGNIVIAV
ncbi:MAG: hydantoinase/oxoprolinase family protein [Candidatus Methanospirareceae archaeon]